MIFKSLPMKRIHCYHSNPNRILLDQILEAFGRIGKLPCTRDLRRKFTIAVVISDEAWRISSDEHRQIKPETRRALFAFCRPFLPDILEPKETGAAA